MEWIIKNEEELFEVARAMIELAGERRKWMFSGDLGAGKTTLVKALCKVLGAADMVTSPTFSLVNEYPVEKGLAYHLDLYRISDVEEALNMGIEEYLDSPYYCFIEWPLVIKPLWPPEVVEINIEILNDSTRKILFL